MAGFPDSFQELHSRRAGCLLRIRVNNHSILSCIRHNNVFGFFGNPNPAVSPHCLPPVRAWQLGRLTLEKVDRDGIRQCHSHLPWIPRSQRCWNAASSALGKILCQPCYCLLAIYTADTQLPGERCTIARGDRVAGKPRSSRPALLAQAAEHAPGLWILRSAKDKDLSSDLTELQCVRAVKLVELPSKSRIVHKDSRWEEAHWGTYPMPFNAQLWFISGQLA